MKITKYILSFLLLSGVASASSTYIGTGDKDHPITAAQLSGYTAAQASSGSFTNMYVRDIGIYTWKPTANQTCSVASFIASDNSYICPSDATPPATGRWVIGPSIYPNLANGINTVPSANLPVATTSVFGAVKTDVAGSVVNNAGVISVTPTSIGHGNVTNDTQAKASIYPNTAPTNTYIPVGDGTKYVATAPAGSLVGLGNVNNTSDANKPVSTATQTALDAKITGPASATSGNLPSFSGTTGKIAADSGILASEVVTKTGTQTLTNKTISGSSNTITNVPFASVIPPANGWFLTVSTITELRAMTYAQMSAGTGGTAIVLQKFNSDGPVINELFTWWPTANSPPAANTYTVVKPTADSDCTTHGCLVSADYANPNPYEFGAYGAARTIESGTYTINSGSTSLSVSGTGFSTCVAGWGIAVPKAGTAGAVLKTTIATCVSSSSVTLANAAGTTQTAVALGALATDLRINFGPTDTTAMNAWANSSNKVNLTCGSYLTDTITVTGAKTGFTQIGAGPQCSKLYALSGDDTQVFSATTGGLLNTTMMGYAVYGVGLTSGGTGHGIDFPAAMYQNVGANIENIFMQGIPGSCLYDGGASGSGATASFNNRVGKLFCFSSGSHNVEIKTGFEWLFENTMFWRTPVGAGKAGLRVHCGDPTLLNINGVSTGDYGVWNGDNSLGCNSYVKFYHGNLEAFSIAGVYNELGALSIDDTSFGADHAGVVALKYVINGGSYRGDIKFGGATNGNGGAFFLNGGTWLNSAPIHFSTAGQFPFSSITYKSTQGASSYDLSALFYDDINGAVKVFAGNPVELVAYLTWAPNHTIPGVQTWAYLNGLCSASTYAGNTAVVSDGANSPVYNAAAAGSGTTTTRLLCASVDGTNWGWRNQ